MLFYQYKDPHVKDKAVSWPSSLTWESPRLGKTVFILRQGPGDIPVPGRLHASLDKTQLCKNHGQQQRNHKDVNFMETTKVGLACGRIPCVWLRIIISLSRRVSIFASHFTGHSVVFPKGYRSSKLMPFVTEIHRWMEDSPHKGSVMWGTFLCNDFTVWSVMCLSTCVPKLIPSNNRKMELPPELSMLLLEVV